ncbi:MAG: IS6 family transposase, partial [Candidatus Micrarchaeia archaeon]
VKTKELLAVTVSWGRHSAVACDFISSVLKTCEGKPVFLVDHAPWYLWAFRVLKLKYEQIAFSTRNCIERWFRTLKERTRRFYNNFMSGRGLIHVVSLLRVFVLYYNFMRIHTKFGKPPGRWEGLS